MKKVNLFAICVMACLLVGCEPKVTEQKPTVLTSSVTDVTTNSAKVSCYVTSDGGAPIIEKGVVYDTHSYPTISGTRCEAGSGAGNYDCTISNLKDGKRYYVRSYAKNAVGIEYGNEIIFGTQFIVSTDDITDVLVRSATVSGHIIKDGDIDIKECGVVWSTSNNPTTSHNTQRADGLTADFQCNLTGLQPKTTYYVRAYAINEKTVSYGEEKIFTTREMAVPTVTTTAVTNIYHTSAIINGHVDFDGGSAVWERGIVYSIQQNPTISDNKITVGVGVGDFSHKLTGLQAGSIYYACAYAINAVGVAYGNQIEFETDKNPEYVDLGLSVKWARFNVGADAPEDFGDYFAWGETEPKTTYNYQNYKYWKSYGWAKYCDDGRDADHQYVLEASDDAATVNWGGTWRMPTKEEFEELMKYENTTKQWTLENHVLGLRLTSKKNGNSIFLPAAGEYSDTLREAGFNGHCAYRTCQRVSKLSGNTDNIVWGLWYCNDTDCPVPIYTYVGRTTGQPVRPVCP